MSTQEQLLTAMVVLLGVIAAAEVARFITSHQYLKPAAPNVQTGK